MAKEPHVWLTPEEAGTLARVSASTIYRWTGRGKPHYVGDPDPLILRCVRTGTYGTRIRADWLDRFMLGEQVSESETKPPAARSSWPR